MAIPVIDSPRWTVRTGLKLLPKSQMDAKNGDSFSSVIHITELVNHGIPAELLERIKNVCAECYKMEREPMFKDSEPVQLLNELLESAETEKKLDDLDWEIMKEYRQELKKLVDKVMEVMDENLGLEKGYIKRAFSSNDQPFFDTKVSHYLPCPHLDRVTGLQAHIDAGGVILFQDEVSGLQILKDGQWIDVQLMANTIVINTGDQIEVLSNGKYKSVWHRMLAKRDRNRRSIVSFYNPSLTATIAPPAEQAAVYLKFVFGDYITMYTKQKFLSKEPRFQAVVAI